ncbi:jg13748 [Pararge aegeria aegeria]|uniref:Jg13748 protein n=1 Tax=Pararge aegeria aegeria TaxID=348720 RepID=A0A8S4QFU2_9NEOP|nr:jg13748 [Pararge aegeria aegeria]
MSVLTGRRRSIMRHSAKRSRVSQHSEPGEISEQGGACVSIQRFCFQHACAGQAARRYGQALWRRRVAMHHWAHPAMALNW